MFSKHREQDRVTPKMSWFQSTSIASLAKNALKEAQKTIDKALEISETEGDGSLSSSTTSEKVAAVTEAATDFFASWGVGGKKKTGAVEEAASAVSDKSSGNNVDNDDAHNTGTGDENRIPPQHKRSHSLEHKLPHNDDTNHGLSDSFVKDIPVTLMPHATTSSLYPSQVSSNIISGTPIFHHHQRSLSDTIFNLTSDVHESVQILDEPEDIGEVGILETVRKPATLSDSQTDDNYSKKIEQNISSASHNSEITNDQPSSKSDCNDDSKEFTNNEQHKANIALETLLTTVDLNSPSADESWGYHHESQPEPVVISNDTQVKNTLMLNSENSVCDSSWSWAEAGNEQIASMFEDVAPPDSPKIVPSSVIEGNQDGTHTDTDCDKKDTNQDNTSAEPQQNISLLDVFPDHPDENETEDSQLESSSGTVLLEPSSESRIEEGDDSDGHHYNYEHEQDDDKNSKPSSPPASSISVPDSPRSSSPMALNNDHLEDSRRGSPENNFEMLSHHSSKLECHSGPEFLPESSRSSSIVVVSSTRASSGGSGSTASTGSDVHRRDRDIDMLEGNHAHHHHCPPQNSGSDGSTGYERVDLPSSAQSSDPTSPEFTKSKHRKGPSSASSSDIEVILSSEYSRHAHNERHAINELNLVPIVSSIHQQTSLDCQDQETQTEPVDEARAIAEEIPNRVTTEISNIIAEKDQMIDQLREEGEKLSKKQFDLSQVIKKLRAKEKEIENTVKGLNGELAGKNVENDRLMKSFVNKESAEKNLSDQVHKLTAEKRTLELKIEQIHSELEDSKENCSTMKASVEDASIEILELKNAISSAQRDSTELDKITREKADLVSRNESLQKELENLRSTINSNQGKASTREIELQNQIGIQTRKVHELQNQLADVSTEIADATMPLSLEIEKLQVEIKQSQLSYEKRETFLNSQVIELESKYKSTSAKEGALKDQIATQEATISILETKLQQQEVENRNLKRDVTFREENEQKRIQEKLVKISRLETQIEKLTSEIERLNQDNEHLGIELKSEKLSLEQERKRNQSLLDQLSSTGGGGRNINQQQHKTSTVSNPNMGNFTKSGENSPGCNSVTSETSYLDEVFDPHGGQFGNRGIITPRSFFDSYSSTGLLEHLQTQLRQREAEVVQFQEEIQKNEKIRKSLNDEIAKLTMRNHEFQLEAERLSELQPKLQELDTNYNALLQLYGEKVEEADELRLDLQDVKDMYKTQIEQLLKR